VRRDAAIDAALAVAADLGIRVRTPVVLTDWNNTLIRLAPAPIVAKVGTSHFRDARLESLERELAVSAHLAAYGAPVVAPALGVPQHARGLTVTLWEYVEPVAEAVPDPAALARVQGALSDFEGELPWFGVELDDARRLLERAPALAADDRRFLLGAVDELAPLLPPGGRPLHGSPHAANWLLSADGPRLLDFETACLGPLEWDLTTMGDADDELSSTLRRMRSVCVAAKCWVAPERNPVLREAAEVHLKLLRGQRVD